MELPRTVLEESRKIEFIEENIGKVIIFCEGKSEKLYLEYFTKIIDKTKYDDICIKIEPANGNAKRVCDFANKFLEDDINNKYGNYKKYLVFDCDAPSNIQEVIKNVDEMFELLVSNYLFETWLLMHFEEVDTKLSKRIISEKLNEHLHEEYSKANSGQIREIINNGNVTKAIENGIKLENKYKEKGISIKSNIEDMNPYTNIYKLVEQLAAKIS